MVNATSYSWNGTHYIINVLEFQTDTIKIYFYPAIAGAGRPIIQNSTAILNSVSSNYDEVSRNITLTLENPGTIIINPEWKFTPDYYKITGHSDWFWNGIEDLLEVKGISSATINVYWR